MNIKNEGRFPSSFILCLFRRLPLNNCLGRALSGAGATLQALLGIDLIVQIAHVDCFSRALSCAGTAGQALIGNNKSHDVTSYVI